MTAQDRSKVRSWFSVTTPDGVIEYKLPKYLVNMEPDDIDKQREIYKASFKYNVPVIISDHPLKENKT